MPTLPPAPAGAPLTATEVVQGQLEQEQALAAALGDIQRSVEIPAEWLRRPDVQYGLSPAMAGLPGVTISGAGGGNTSASVLTMDMLNSARELLAQNADVDLEERQRQNAEYSRLMRDRDYMPEGYRRDLENARRGRAVVDLRITEDDRSRSQVLTARLAGLHVQVRTEGDHTRHDNPRARAMISAQAIAARFAEEIERDVFEQLSRLNERQLDMRPGAVNIWDDVRHAMDLGVGIFGPRSRPETATRIPGVDKFPSILTFGKFTATLLADDQMIWDEGEKMGHCLGTSYTQRIMKGSYLVYHVEMPGSRNGLTLGFKHSVTLGFKHSVTHRYDPVGPAWHFDQLKGKANSTKHNKDADVVAMRNYVLNSLNNGAKP